MARALPIYKLEGIDFYVDVKKAELIEAKTPFINKININELEDEGTHYNIHWNKVDKNQDTYDAFIRRNLRKNTTSHQFADQAPITRFYEEQKHNVVTIPPMKDLDPQGMAETYHIPVHELASKTDWEIMVDQRLYAMRIHSGMLPQVIIDKHTFYVDYRMNELRPHDDFMHTIQFRDLINYNIGGASPGSVRVPYQPAKHSLSFIDLKSVTSIPNGIMIIDIPLPSTLDPVGAARDLGVDIKAYLRSHPLKDTTEVKSIPWNDTIIPAVIEKNKQAKKTKKSKSIRK